MAKEMMREETIKEIFKATPHLLKFPGERMWIDLVVAKKTRSEAGGCAGKTL